MKFLHKTKKGFSLIEMIVAVAVFTVVVIIAMGTYLNASSLQRRAVAARALNDNLSFAFEVITREIRDGHDFFFSGNQIDFKNNFECDISYYLLGGKLYRYGSLDTSISCLNPEDRPLTSSEIEINNLEFNLAFDNPSNLRKMIIINMNGFINLEKGDEYEFNLQTAATQQDI